MNYKQLSKYPNVIGAGTGPEGATALVRKKYPLTHLAASEVIPEHIDVIEVGDVRALASPTDRWRPVPAGVSIGHHKITAGTLGSFVRIQSSQLDDDDYLVPLILSNNHVLANSNDASPGDPILQPGPADGGTDPDDIIAWLLRFIPLDFGEGTSCPVANGAVRIANLFAKLTGSQSRLSAHSLQSENKVDAALAIMNDGIEIDDQIIDIGKVEGTRDAELGMPLRKHGRTSGYNEGRVIVMDATISVGYGGGRQATFIEQVVTTPMLQPGDSGSLIVHGNELKAVGLGFAGSSQTAIFNPIAAVVEALRFEI